MPKTHAPEPEGRRSVCKGHTPCDSSPATFWKRRNCGGSQRTGGRRAGGRRREKQAESEGFGGGETTPYDTTFVQTHRMCKSRANPDVNCGLPVTMTCRGGSSFGTNAPSGGGVGCGGVHGGPGCAWAWLQVCGEAKCLPLNFALT